MIGDRPIELEVDGGVSPGNAGALAAAGATVLVAGSAVFDSDHYARAIAALKKRRDMSRPRPRSRATGPYPC